LDIHLLFLLVIFSKTTGIRSFIQPLEEAEKLVEADEPQTQVQAEVNNILLVLAPIVNVLPEQIF
jgi:hypothetical protein